MEKQAFSLHTEVFPNHKLQKSVMAQRKFSIVIMNCGGFNKKIRI